MTMRVKNNLDAIERKPFNFVLIEREVGLTPTTVLMKFKLFAWTEKSAISSLLQNIVKFKSKSINKKSARARVSSFSLPLWSRDL